MLESEVNCNSGMEPT